MLPALRELSPSAPPSDTMSPMRTAVRFPLRLCVRVSTELGQVEAMTQDISATGVLFTMPFAPDVNSRLTWMMSLPISSGYEVRVHCVGRVVWTGQAGRSRQVGAVIDDYHIGDRSDD